MAKWISRAGVSWRNVLTNFWRTVYTAPGIESVKRFSSTRTTAFRSIRRLSFSSQRLTFFTSISRFRAFISLREAAFRSIRITKFISR